MSNIDPSPGPASDAASRFRFLAEAIPQMVWTATPEGALDYVNGQVCR